MISQYSSYSNHEATHERTSRIYSSLAGSRSRRQNTPILRGIFSTPGTLALTQIDGDVTQKFILIPLSYTCASGACNGESPNHIWMRRVMIASDWQLILARNLEHIFVAGGANQTARLGTARARVATPQKARSTRTSKTQRAAPGRHSFRCQ